MIKNKIIMIFRKLIRSVEYEAELDTLFYFLNSYNDITKFPKATGSVGRLQECDTILLKIFHEICKREGLEYWLDYGTLLGSLRHKGFIPWDDDLDVGMLREDYEKAVKILPRIFEKYGIEAGEDMEEPSVRIGIGYKHKETGIWLDVFPVDVISKTAIDEDSVILLRKIVSKYKKEYIKCKNKKNRDELIILRSKAYKKFNGIGEKTILCHGPEFMYPKILVHDYDEVFPLSAAKFGDYEFCVPNKTTDYLRGIYGPNYMSFPRNGVLHHGTDSVSLHQWAEYSGTNMAKVKEELLSILEKVEKD